MSELESVKSTTSHVTRSQTKKTLGDIVYTERADFPHGKLPTKKEILEYMLYLLRPKKAGQNQRSKDEAAGSLAEILQEHWLFCNIYAMTRRSVKLKILDLYSNFITLTQTRKNRRNEIFLGKVEEFNKDANKLFDIFCVDTTARENLEKIFGVKMTEEEWRFYNDQKSERKMYCEDFVDKKWLKTHERRQRELQNLDDAKRVGESKKEMLQPVSFDDLEDMSQTDDGETSQEDLSEPENSGKRRRMSCEHDTGVNDELPKQYRHIRISVRKVRPEYYETVDKLKSCFHMSEAQAEAAVVIVGNKMFGRSWQFHSESDTINLDTLPHAKNVRDVGKSIEAMALHEIVKDIMASSQQVTVTYADDGSRKQGAGSFSVQGIHINGIYRALPTLPISSETRNNLADLKLAVLNLLEAASGVSSKELFEKIDFVMTDQTAHNFQTDEIVSEQLETEHIPSHLFCNVHPTLMFNRVITKQWAAVENNIGRDKIFSSFLVNATTNASSVTEQALDCLTRLINHDFDHKPWNKSNEFDLHIAPKQNKSVSLKDERFNRLTLTCAVSLYHLDDIWSFLDKYDNITNQLACIVRCFLELEFLKVLYCTGALIGLHLVEPYLALTTSTSTTYSTLIPAFHKLYNDLVKVDPEKLLDVTEPALTFVTPELFDKCKYDDDICVAISAVCSSYREQIIKMLSKLLPELANGFKKQKGAIFGFGETNESPHSLSSMSKDKLENAPVHNLQSERSVGFVNYELSRRGASQLNAASAAQVKSKSADLIERRDTGSFKEYSSLTKQGSAIPEILRAWQQKQQELQKSGLQEKEIANLSVDKRKTKDLAMLKEMGGPLTSVADLEKLMRTRQAESTKQKRLYLEVRYARDTSLSLPKTSDIFRLLKDHAKLPSVTYAKNLKVYLSNVSSKSEATLEDFVRALDEL